MVKKLLLTLSLFYAMGATLIAQTPQAVCYQAVAKDNLGNNIIQTTIGIRAAIVADNLTGTEVWIETFTPQTDQFALFTVNIGEGVRVGGSQTNFEDIDWSLGNYWLRIEMDVLGGQDYLLMGGNKILSVPYALYSENSKRAEEALIAQFADSAAVANSANTAINAQFAAQADSTNFANIAQVAHSTIGDNDPSSSNELQTLILQNDTLYIQSPDGSYTGTGIFIDNTEIDGDITNELQTLILQNDTLYIQSPDGSYTGAGVFIDNTELDGDITNELQTLILQNDTLYIQSPDGSYIGPGIFIDNTEQDGDITNELQELTLQNGVLHLITQNGSLSNTGIPIDDNALNELQDLIVQNDTLYLQNQNGNLSNTGVFVGESANNGLQDLTIQNDTLYLQDQNGNLSNTGILVDGDANNELQDLTIQNDTLYLQDQNGNLSNTGILVDGDANNELQDLTIQNDSIYLQNQNGSLSSTGIQVDRDTTNEIQLLEFDGESISISGGNSVVINDNKKPFQAVGSSDILAQGILGGHVVKGSGPFEVPSDKNFWVTASGPTIKLFGYGLTPFVDHPTTPNMPVFPPGTELEDCMCTGILIDTTYLIEPVIIDFVGGASNYTVPPGKILFIKSGMHNDQVARLVINGEQMEFIRPNFTRGTRIVTLPEGTVVGPTFFNQTTDIILTGFLVDQDL